MLNFLAKLIPKTNPPQPTECMITSQELGELSRPLTKYVYWFDRKYYYVTTERWLDLLDNILYGKPSYKEDKFDCEDFAMRTKVRSGEYYGLNAIGIVVGNSPWGYHSWNSIYNGQDIYYLEPQNGNIWLASSNPAYKADWIWW